MGLTGYLEKVNVASAVESLRFFNALKIIIVVIDRSLSSQAQAKIVLKIKEIRRSLRLDVAYPNIGSYIECVQ